MVLSTRLAIGALLLPLFYVLDQSIHTQYIFDPTRLQQISQRAIQAHGNNTLPLMEQLTRDLKTEYGDAIADWSREDWFFNNHGGAMGTMVILHASISEYLIFYGSALGTEGHSGVHPADDYFIILVGEEHVADPGDLTATIYRPGEMNHMRRGVARQYSMPGACFALELAQGWIPAMLPFGFADTFTSTLDFANLWKTVRVDGGAHVVASAEREALSPSI